MDAEDATAAADRRLRVSVGITWCFQRALGCLGVQWRFEHRTALAGPRLALCADRSAPEELAVGSRRWLLFDPEHTWQVSHDDEAAPMAANLALLNRDMRGRVTACGLSR